MAGEDFFQIGQRPLTQAEAMCRAVFLDFDNPNRPRRVPVVPAPTEEELSKEAIDRILATLNDVFAEQEIQFFTEPPPGDNYYTINVNGDSNTAEPTPPRSEVVDIEATELQTDTERRIVDAIAARAEAMLKKRTY